MALSKSLKGNMTSQKERSWPKREQKWCEKVREGANLPNQVKGPATLGLISKWKINGSKNQN